MPILDLIRRRDSSLVPLSPQVLVARYQRMRAVSRKLNNAMVERLPKDVLHEGGRKLGLLHDGTFVFDNEQETAILMDYCLYHVRRSGLNAVERYCRDNPPASGTDEWSCLNAMRNAIHSLFRVDEVERGVGLAVTDLATDQQYLLVDIGLSESATPGLLFLSGMSLFEDFAATGGAALVLGKLSQKEMDAFSANWKKVSTSRDADYDPSPMIRDLLHRQVASRMRYREDPSSSVAEPQMVRISRRQRIAMLKDAKMPAANRRCPCGSGKMFKNCCLEKQR